MKEYYYMVNLPEKLSEISVNDFCEVFEDLTGKYDGMWIKVMQTEKWGNFSNHFILYNSNKLVNIEYKGWKLRYEKSKENKFAYYFYSNWNYTSFGALLEDTFNNTKSLNDDCRFWEVFNGYHDRSPKHYIASFIKKFGEMVENNHDLIYYDLSMNSIRGRLNRLTVALDKYKTGFKLETGTQKIEWLENQCIRCLELSKKYIEENFFPKESVSDILKRYEDALKQALELYKEELEINKD